MNNKPRRLRCLKSVLLITLGILVFASCTAPSPLYGSWADNKGNSFTFVDDGTFSARIYSAGILKNYDGDYTLLMNVITLDCKSEELRIVTEWDIRGNILYLDWTSAEGQSMSLSLYKISN
ncbi:MAG: hypothetical protein FWB95_06110 [Treponema sp.]|nr:hypothetical protein [Treponema sp.]